MNLFVWLYFPPVPVGCSRPLLRVIILAFGVIVNTNTVSPAFCRLFPVRSSEHDRYLEIIMELPFIKVASTSNREDIGAARSGYSIQKMRILSAKNNSGG